MTQPFIGQVQPFGFGFAPRYWAQCNGQTLSIQQNAALFSLLGTMCGGNGISTFMLPNLQSSVPMHFGTSPAGDVYVQGEFAGEEQVTLTINTMAMHNHTFLGSSASASTTVPAAGQALAKTAIPSGTPDSFYGPDATPQTLNSASIGAAGGNAPHANLQPYLAINWCIALYGIFPSRN
ncbi:MAG: tail fiber protein [Xanthobacteraceae bacterium]